MSCKWVLKKDLPNAKAGTVGEEEVSLLGASCWTFCGAVYDESFLLNHPDWFERVQDPQRWRAEVGGKYWTVHTTPFDYLKVIEQIETGGFEENLWRCGFYFKTKEQAEEVAQKFREILKEIHERE